MKKLRLNGVTKTKIFINEKPAFSVRYPENLLELKPNPLTFPIIKPIFAASLILGLDLLIFVSTFSDGSLEEILREITSRLKPSVRGIKIIFNKPIGLKDG
ncbi:MAG: hypothetical protein ACFFG0_56425 [Candidatus Thorarchaeota archaeon]